jgi:hypothetical protein
MTVDEILKMYQEGTESNMIISKLARSMFTHLKQLKTQDSEAFLETVLHYNDNIDELVEREFNKDKHDILDTGIIGLIELCKGDKIKIKITPEIKKFPRIAALIR